MANIKKQRQIDIMDQFWNPHKDIYNPNKKWERKKRCKKETEVSVGPIDFMVQKNKRQKTDEDKKEQFKK